MKLFSKIASAIVGIAMAIGVGVAVSSVDSKSVSADSTVNFKLSSASNVTVDGVTARFAKGSGQNDPAWYSAGLRLYASNTVTISSSNTITGVSFNWEKQGNKAFASMTANKGTYSHPSAAGTGTWSGSETEIVFTLGSSGQLQLNTFSVSYSGGEPTTEYTIQYDKNNSGASGTMENTVGANPEVQACGFTAPEGLRFKEWNVESDGSGVSYAPGDHPKADLTLYAIWEEKPSEVTLDKIGSTLSSTANTTMQTVDIKDGTETYTLNYLQCKKQGDSMLMTKSVNPFISNHTEMPKSIKSVILYINSGASGSTTYDVAFGTSEYTTATAGIGAVNITGGNNHKFEANIEDATYFCVTLGNANNGQVLKIVVELDSTTLPQLAIYNNMSQELSSYSVIVGESASTLLARNKSTSQYVNDVVWTSGNDDILQAVKNSYEVYITGLSEGETTLTASCEGYKSATITVTVEPDPTLPEMEIWDSSAKVDGTNSYVFSTTVGIYKFYAHPAEDSETVLNADSWASSDESVATIERNSDGYGVLNTLAIGETYLTASKSGYQNVTAKITVSKGSLVTVIVGGEMTKTSYTTADTEWSSAGLTATAQYNHGYEEDVTSSVTWTFSPASPSGLEGNVNVTPYANYEEESYAGAVQACTVTVSHTGTAEDPFTVAEGIAKCQEIGTTASGDWYVKGYITEITSSAADADKYGNATFNLADSIGSSDILIAFQVKNIGGVAFTTETFNTFAAGAVGKIAVVHGPLVNYKGNTPEFSGKSASSLVSLEDAPTGDIDVTFTAFANCEVGASGTFTASTTATNPVYTWSVDDSTIMTVDASTGVYSAKKVGVVTVTVNVSADEGEGHASVAITVNGSETDLTSIAEANSIAASLATGKTTSYYVYVGGYVKEFGTSMSGDKPRAFDIMNFDEDVSIMVYTNVDPYEDFVSGLSLGDYVIVKANIQNYGGVYELTGPEKISSEYTGVSFAFELLKQTDAVCSNVEIEDKGTALEEIWPSLKALYDGIDPELQEDVIYSSTDEKGTTLQKAMARYDRLVTKYGLTNFVVGREPSSLNNTTSVVTNNNNSTSSIVVVTVIALTSISAIAVLLVIKRRKTY